MDNIYFITPLFKNGNLAEYTYGSKRLSQITDEIKIKYLLQIAVGMNYLLTLIEIISLQPETIEHYDS
jgi:hypothetical protein